jgi:DNA-binding NtrC family response regulator
MMERRSVLVVDDEKNIRLTMSRALEDGDVDVLTADTGEEALAAMAGRNVDVVLLDLRMPGMDGIDVLRRVAREHPNTRVIIITAYGTVERAVEAMKLGAVDFLEKPVTPAEVRGRVAELLDRGRVREEAARSYDEYLQLAKRFVNERRFDSAASVVDKAIAADSTRAEAFNLKGVLLEIRGDVPSAQKMYRVALKLDPGYKQARVNLDRSGEFGTHVGPSASEPR